MTPAPGRARAPQARPLSEVLAALPEGRPVALGEVLGAMGARAHGCALLLLALPDALPLPIPSLSALLGLPLLVVSAHLAAFGEGGPLPQRLRDRPLPEGLIRALRGRVAPVMARAERLSRVRWLALARRERLLGLVCLWLSMLLLLPLPLFNTPPALCLALLAWGMVQRDGAAVAAGLAGTLAVTAALGWVAGRLHDLLAAWLPALG